MSLPRMTFLVNNDHELPEDFVVIRNEENLPEDEFFNKHLEALFNPTVKLNPVALIGEDTELDNPHLESMIVGLFDFYPEVGFVFTDALIKVSGQEFIDYFSGLDLPDESFFINLTIPVRFDGEPQSKIRVMQQMMQANKLFVHLPDPLITVYNQ